MDGNCNLTGAGARSHASLINVSAFDWMKGMKAAAYLQHTQIFCIFFFFIWMTVKTDPGFQDQKQIMFIVCVFKGDFGPSLESCL